MNTRLQVEHPVTECTTGVDLVALQIRVAEGERLPPAPPPPSGHAIEVRLYAEDPTAAWQPHSGTLHEFDVPGVSSEFANPSTPGIRLDSGVVAGTVVGIHYDPLLAKVISYAPTRTEAARALAGSLARSRIHGVVTNRDLLVRVLRHPAFLAGDTDTAFFDRHGIDALAEPLAGKDAYRLSALAAALADAARNRAAANVLGGVPSGWRNLPSAPQRKTYDGVGGEHDIDYRLTRDGLVAEGFDGVRLVEATAGTRRPRRRRGVPVVRRRGARRPAVRRLVTRLRSPCAESIRSPTRPITSSPAHCWRRCLGPSPASSSRSAIASSAASHCCGWRR